MDQRATWLQVVTTSSRRGAELFAVDLDRHLRSRGRAIDTVALAPDPIGQRTLPVPLLGKHRLGVSTLRRLRSRLRDAQVVVGHGSTALPACAIAGLGTGVPFVHRVIGDPSAWGTTRARRARIGRALRSAALVAALTDAAAGMLADLYRIPAHRLRVISTGVPGERFPLVDATARAAARRALGLDRSTPVIAFVGALQPEKAPHRAVEAIGAIADAHLVVAGEGTERPRLERLAAEIAPGRVTLLGSLEDPVPVYAAADTVVLPSRTEGLPAALIEAGLSGLPAVTTDVGFVREIVLDGETGFVVPPDDADSLVSALRAACSAPASVGRAARAHCLAHFDMARIADQWDALLSEVAVAAPA